MMPELHEPNSPQTIPVYKSLNAGVDGLKKKKKIKKREKQNDFEKELLQLPFIFSVVC